MKKQALSLLLALCFSLAVICGAAAEEPAAGTGEPVPELLIESISGASDEELEAARQMIIQEQRARIHAYIQLDQTELRIAKGTGVQLSATVEDLLDDLTCGPLSWSSSDESIVTVNKNGQVKALAFGDAEITCSAVLSDETELAAVCKVKVYVQAAKVGAENKALSITKGQTEQIVPVVTPEDTTDPSVSYESSDPAIATVSEEGLVTAVSVGRFSITITAKDGSEKNFVLKGAVLQDVEGIELNSTEVSIPVGKKAALKATLQPADAANKQLTWTSDDESVATVDAKGAVTAVSKGTTTVHAESMDGNGAKADCQVIVVDPVQSITLSETRMNLVATVNHQITAEVLPEDATNKKLTWSSSNENVATVDQDGLISPIAKGSCVITAEAVDGSGVKAQANVAVKEYDVIFLDSKLITVNYETFDMSAGMFMMDWDSKNGKVDVNGDRGSLTLRPLEEGEDVVTVKESEYFSGKTIKKSWTVYVFPEAVNK